MTAPPREPKHVPAPSSFLRDRENAPPGLDGKSIGLIPTGTEDEIHHLAAGKSFHPFARLPARI